MKVLNEYEVQKYGAITRYPDVVIKLFDLELLTMNFHIEKEKKLLIPEEEIIQDCSGKKKTWQRWIEVGNYVLVTSSFTPFKAHQGEIGILVGHVYDHALVLMKESDTSYFPVEGVGNKLVWLPYQSLRVIKLKD